MTPEDLEANAEFVRLADQYVLAPGGANHNNYANCEFIAEVARSKQERTIFKFALSNELIVFQKKSPIYSKL